MSSLVRHHSPNRRQPDENGHQPRVFGLPDEMLVVRNDEPAEDARAKLIHISGLLLHILEYTMEEEFETDLWEWLAQIRRVCRAFRDLTPELVPTKFSPTEEEMNRRGALVCRLTRSFPTAPWKTAKLVRIFNWSWSLPYSHGDPEWRHSFLQALRQLLETPGSLPKLEELQLWTTDDRGVVDADFLYAIAQNLPRLSHLALQDENYSGLGEHVTPIEFGTFAQLLQRPLQTLSLLGCGMTDAHLNAFFSHHNGSSLTELDIGRNFLVSNSALNTISRHCSNLVRLSLNGSLITSSGLEVILQANHGICHLNLSHCERLSPDSIAVLSEHAPQLESLDVSLCDWFTDACLDRLVQGQIYYWAWKGKTEIPLVVVDAGPSQVSHAGVHRVVAKPHVGSLTVHVE